jgi:hypothetical protein
VIRGVLLAALASGILVAGYLALGGGGYEVGAPPDPCSDTGQPAGEGVGGTVERLALTSLDGAACELGVTRERLLLVLAGEVEAPPELEDERRRSDAFRAGLRRAVDAEAEAGRLGATEAFVLRQAIQFAPVEALLERLFGGG